MYSGLFPAEVTPFETITEDSMKTLRPPPLRDGFASGQTVPRSGNYKTLHPHPVTPEVTLLSKNVFPSCPLCRPGERCPRERRSH